MPRSILLLSRRALISWSLLAGCAAQHEAEGSRPSDTKSDPSESEPEQLELRLLVRNVFIELQRDGELRCPCLVAAGESASLDACIKEVNRGARDIDCIEAALSEAAIEAQREPLECMLAERRATNACLASARCDVQLTRCYSSTPSCPTLDPSFISQASFHCNPSM